MIRKLLKYLRQALKFGSKDYFDLLNTGNIKIYQEIIKAFDKVLELNPDDEYALSRKGSALDFIRKI